MIWSNRETTENEIKHQYTIWEVCLLTKPTTCCHKACHSIVSEHGCSCPPDSFSWTNCHDIYTWNPYSLHSADAHCWDLPSASSSSAPQLFVCLCHALWLLQLLSCSSLQSNSRKCKKQSHLCTCLLCFPSKHHTSTLHTMDMYWAVLLVTDPNNNKEKGSKKTMRRMHNIDMSSNAYRLTLFLLGAAFFRVPFFGVPFL